jgi:hypothetical protein
MVQSGGRGPPLKKIFTIAIPTFYIIIFAIEVHKFASA